MHFNHQICRAPSGLMQTIHAPTKTQGIGASLRGNLQETSGNRGFEPVIRVGPAHFPYTYSDNMCFTCLDSQTCANAGSFFCVMPSFWVTNKSNLPRSCRFQTMQLHLGGSESHRFPVESLQVNQRAMSLVGLQIGLVHHPHHAPKPQSPQKPKVTERPRSG